MSTELVFHNEFGKPVFLENNAIEDDLSFDNLSGIFLRGQDLDETRELDPDVDFAFF